ncbi:MAG: sterol desaturase family protein [Pseudomonadota bacterium]
MSALDLMDPMVFSGFFVLAVFIVVFAIEMAAGRVLGSQRPLRDCLFMLTGMLSQSMLSSALVGAVAGATAIYLWPDSAGSLAAVSFWIAFPMIFIGGEFLQYIIHRYACEWRWLWKIHRMQDNALNLGATVLYRYNVFWVLLLPQIWFGAFAVYLGQGWAFVAAVLITYMVNVMAHVSFRWDLWLRRIFPSIEPAWDVFEKFITTPDAHHAHHAYGKTAHPNGNYAITLFIFDVLLGTAKLPGSRQTQCGLTTSPRLHWAEGLFWPLVRKPPLPKSDSRSR